MEFSGSGLHLNRSMTTFDISFDLKTFWERTCRTCSRFFEDNGEVEMFRIFAVETGGASASPRPRDGSMAENKDDKRLVLSDAVKEIYEELLVWKLNIKPSDGLPQQICHDCLERFCNIKCFRKECLSSQKMMESYLKDINNMLESNNMGRHSPNNGSETGSGMQRVSPSSFNAEDLVEEVPESPKLEQHPSPLGSPKFRLSPRFHEKVYAESSMGTPPPLFEEINTEPIDVQTMECMKTEAELDLLSSKQDAAQQNVGDEQERRFKVLKKTPSPQPLQFRYSSSDEESSTPSTDDEAAPDAHDAVPTTDSEAEAATDTDDDDAVSELESESAYSLISHTNKFDARNPLQCRICYVHFPKRSLLQEHRLRVHPQEKPFCCNLCPSAFKSNFQLSQHKLKHNSPNSIKCELCGKFFRSQLHLQRHTKNFHLTSTYTCHICHEKFENYTQIRFQYHVRTHGEKRFHCQFCDKSFHQKVHLLNHERTHTGDQPFRCDICGNSFRQQTACQEHMLKHKDPTPFKCTICAKGFRNRSTLRLHLRTHANIKSPLVCELCGQNFADKIKYELHKRTHTAASPSHIYEITQKQQRHRKKRIHTCAYCGKAFAAETTLKAHLQTHAQPLMSFKCQYCDKSFQTAPLLLRHEQQHSSLHQRQRFECSFCSETFVYRSTLGQHMLSHLENDNGDDEDSRMSFSRSTSI